MLGMSTRVGMRGMPSWLLISLLALAVGRPNKWPLPGQEQDISEEHRVRVSSGTESYFSVRVPRSTPDLYIYAQSQHAPIQLAVSMGYFPKESHFDTSNFATWAMSGLNSDVHVPLSALRLPRCDGDDGVLESCLIRASGDNDLRCGAEAWPALELDGIARAEPCPKQIGQCTHGMCQSHLQGPTVCNISNAWSGSGDCVCQRGFCATAGSVCADADSVQPGCAKVTGRTCSFYTCEPEYGPANCEDGLCICAPGHCSVNGVCQPGPLCQELSHQAICEVRVLQMPNGPMAPDLAMEGIATPPPVTSAAKPDQQECCNLMNAARKRDPGRFARCAAGHFFSVTSARARGVQVPVLADLAAPGEAADELIIMARSAASDQPFAGESLAAKMGAAPDARDEWITFFFDFDGSRSDEGYPLDHQARAAASTKFLNWAPIPLQPLQHFRTLEELISPSRSATGSLKAALEQLEVPLLQADAVPDITTLVTEPSLQTGGLPLRLRRNEPLLLHLGETHRAAALQQGLHGELELHLRGLPKDTAVLYSRAFPAPRSLLDFGHAKLVRRSEDQLQHGEWVNNNRTVWRAKEQFATQYFAVLPAMDGHAMAHFAVQTLPSAGALAAETSQQFSGPTPPLPLSDGVAVETPNAMPQDGLGDTHWFSLVWFGLTLCISSFAVCRWVLKRDAPDRAERGANVDSELDSHRSLFDTLSETPRLLFNAPRRYMPVMGSEQEAADSPSTPPRGCSDAEVPKSPVLSSLKVFGLAVAKQLSQARTAAGLTSNRRFLDCDGEDSDDYDDLRSPYRGSGDQDCEEARGLLSRRDDDDGEQSGGRGRRGRSPVPTFRGQGAAPPKSPIDRCDRDAVNALMKLRPAARDSLGDDTLEDTDGPLMGTDRSAMLSR